MVVVTIDTNWIFNSGKTYLQNTDKEMLLCSGDVWLNLSLEHDTNECVKHMNW